MIENKGISPDGWQRKLAEGRNLTESTIQLFERAAANPKSVGDSEILDAFAQLGVELNDAAQARATANMLLAVKHAAKKADHFQAGKDWGKDGLVDVFGMAPLHALTTVGYTAAAGVRGGMAVGGTAADLVVTIGANTINLAEVLGDNALAYAAKAVINTIGKIGEAAVNRSGHAKATVTVEEMKGDKFAKTLSDTLFEVRDDVRDWQLEQWGHFANNLGNAALHLIFGTGVSTVAGAVELGVSLVNMGAASYYLAREGKDKLDAAVYETAGQAAEDFGKVAQEAGYAILNFAEEARSEGWETVAIGDMLYREALLDVGEMALAGTSSMVQILGGLGTAKGDKFDFTYELEQLSKVAIPTEEAQKQAEEAKA